MKSLLIFAGYYIKKPAMIISAVLIFIVCFLSPSYQKVAYDLPCSLYCADDSTEAADAVAFLERQGYVLCETEEEAVSMVKNGTADCATVIDDGFGERVKTEPSGCIRLISSDRSGQREKYMLLSGMAVLCARLPYITLETAQSEGYEYDEELLRECYEQVYGSVPPLDYEIITASGGYPAAEPDKNLPLGVSAICSFALMAFTAFGQVRRNAARVSVRFTRKGLFVHCLIPQIFAAAVILFIASAAGTLAGFGVLGQNQAAAILSLLCFYLISAVILSVLCMVPAGSDILISVVAADTVAAIFLCPIFISVEVLANALVPLRAVCVPYYIYPIYDFFSKLM